MISKQHRDPMCSHLAFSHLLSLHTVQSLSSLSAFPNLDCYPAFSFGVYSIIWFCAPRVCHGPCPWTAQKPCFFVLSLTSSLLFFFASYTSNYRLARTARPCSLQPGPSQDIVWSRTRRDTHQGGDQRDEQLSNVKTTTAIDQGRNAMSTYNYPNGSKAWSCMLIGCTFRTPCRFLLRNSLEAKWILSSSVLLGSSADVS